MRKHDKIRAAFTMVELLVVIGLMGVLAALAIGYFPNAANQQREAKAATLVQGWLNIAKQRALRDQAPRGVRLLIGQSTIGNNPITNVVTDCQNIEQPDDFWGGFASRLQSAPPNALPAGYTPQNTLILIGAPDLLNGYATADPPSFWAVQTGDSLEIFGTGLMYTITSVMGPTQFTIDPPMPYPLTAGTNGYRILRAPRAVGSDKMTLPVGTVIDIGTNATFGNPLPSPPGGGFIDILFAPSGAVITRGVSTSTINLWVRAPDQANLGNVFAGKPTIVSVFARTGFVGAFPPDATPNGSPYSQVK